MMKHKRGRVMLTCSVDSLLEGAAPIALRHERVAEAAAKRLACGARELVILNRRSNFGFFTGLLRRWGVVPQ